MCITLKKFNDELFDAFPVSYPAGLKIVGYDCDECSRVKQDFLGQDWTAITNTTIERHYGSLARFTPDAFRYFLPAFLRATLSNPDSKNAEFLIYSLAPSGIHSSEVQRFSAPQRNLVVTFLDLLRPRDECVQDMKWAKIRARWASA